MIASTPSSPSPFAEPRSGNHFGSARARIGCIGAVDAGFADDAAALGLAVETIALSEFIDGLPFRGTLLWVAAADDDVIAALPAIGRRQAEEAIPLIVDTGIATVDAVIAALGLDGDAAILIDPTADDRMATIARQVGTTRATLHDSVADSRADDIVSLQDEVARISRMLARLSRDELDPAPSVPSPFIDDQVRAPRRSFIADDSARSAPVSVRDVRLVIRQRRLRDELFDAELFADPAWDMLLDLYAARLDRHRVSVSSLCIAAAVPATTALRWIKSLTDQGLFERQEDPHDGRRIFVGLSDRAAAAMQRYFNRLGDPHLAV